MKTKVADKIIVEGFDRFEALFNESQEQTLVPVKPYEGDFLDLYEDFDVIHGGGEGSVIKATRRSDGKTVALKKYFRGGIKTADDWQNAEIAAGRERSFLERAARDGVQNVPRLLDFGTTGHLYEAVVAMEYVEGRTLDAVINGHGFIPDIDEAVRITKEVAKPLQYAHEDLGGFVHRDVKQYAHEQLGGFVHRDVKPANIMVGDDGKVTLLDWSSVRDRGLTLKNTQLYSPNYTAPEVLEGRSVTPAADVYSLGKTLEHCLLGSLFEEKQGMVTEEDLRRKNVPDHMIDTLMKATQVHAHQRYQSVGDFVNDLEKKVEVAVEEDISVSSQSEVDRKKSWLYAKADLVQQYCAAIVASSLGAWAGLSAGSDFLALNQIAGPSESLLFLSGSLAFAAYKHVLRPLGMKAKKIYDDGFDLRISNGGALAALAVIGGLAYSGPKVMRSVQGTEKVGTATVTETDEGFVLDDTDATGVAVSYRFLDDAEDFCRIEHGDRITTDVGCHTEDIVNEEESKHRKFTTSIYERYGIEQRILDWKAKHLEGGVLGGEEIHVTPLGFTIDLEELGINYADRVDYRGTVVSQKTGGVFPGWCKFENVREHGELETNGKRDGEIEMLPYDRPCGVFYADEELDGRKYRTDISKDHYILPEERQRREIINELGLKQKIKAWNAITNGKGRR